RLRCRPRHRVLRSACSPKNRARERVGRLSLVFIDHRYRPKPAVQHVISKRRKIMIITHKAISRRTLLRGMGATLALPLLDAMVPALAAQSRTAAKPVHRFGVMYVPNGMIMNKWTPAMEGAAFEFSPTLASLAPYRDQLLVLTSLASVPTPGRPGGAHAKAPTR